PPSPRQRARGGCWPRQQSCRHHRLMCRRSAPAFLHISPHVLLSLVGSRCHQLHYPSPRHRYLLQLPLSFVATWTLLLPELCPCQEPHWRKKKQVRLPSVVAGAALLNHLSDQRF
ncbi:unnamed protein product, partial [Ectocarpus sp. 12 AP-2014]